MENLYSHPFIAGIVKAEGTSTRNTLASMADSSREPLWSFEVTMTSMNRRVLCDSR